jgi:hypothetical protein
MTENAWTTGLCCSMAVALHQRYGFPIHGIVWRVPGNAEEYAELFHAFVICPDGQALDANGLQPISEMGEIGRVWESGIGDDRHPKTGGKGQWWDATLEPIPIPELCEMRAAVNDPLVPELLADANDWIEERLPSWICRCSAMEQDDCCCCPSCWTPQGDEAIATNGCEDPQGCGLNRFMDDTIPQESGA